MKCLILYASIHHGNTKKLIDGLKNEYDVDLIDAIKDTRSIDFSHYDTIGFASGVYNGSISPILLKFVKTNATTLNKKKIFAIITSGTNSYRYRRKTKRFFNENGVQLYAIYQCLGYDTYGLCAKIGGIAKGHPNRNDIDKLLIFVKENDLF